MVSHKLKCIFIEIPKTASTSIRKVLGFATTPHLDILETKNNMLNQWPFKESDNSFKGIIGLNKLVPLKIREKKINKLFSEYFKFGFVRNPWDRVVSLYLRREGIKMSEMMTFEEFVRWIQNSSDTSIHTSVHKNQLDWFTDETGKVSVDFIGKFENLNTDFEIIKKQIGLDVDLPHENKTKVKKMHYTEYYTPKTKDIIAEKFKVDIEYFGYEFGK